MTNRRGNGSRRRPIGGNSGLGNRGPWNRRNGSARAAPSELRSMSSTRLGCVTDPPPCETTTTLTRRIQFGVFIAVGVHTEVVKASRFASLLPGAGQRLRILKVSVWGPSSATNEYTMRVKDGLGNGDGAEFVDRNVIGQSRAAISYRPAFAGRESWLIPTEEIFEIIYTADNPGGLNVLEVTAQIIWSSEGD